jgi:hypothetical protein
VQGDRVTDPRGLVVTGGDWHPLCLECSHRLVTSSVVGRSGTGYWMPGYIVLGHDVGSSIPSRGGE